MVKLSVLIESTNHIPSLAFLSFPPLKASTSQEFLSPIYYTEGTCIWNIVSDMFLNLVATVRYSATTFIKILYKKRHLPASKMPAMY